MFYDLKERRPTGFLPAGTMGQISFERLVGLLLFADELKPDETVTHLDVDISRGMLRFRIEQK